MDDERYYCTLCLDEVKKSPPDKQHISSVQATTSSGNLITHLSVKHHLEDVKDEAVNRVTNYFRAHATGTPCTSSYELNRELSLWCCRDLLLFGFVKKDVSEILWLEIFLQFLCRALQHWQVKVCLTYS